MSKFRYVLFEHPVTQFIVAFAGAAAIVVTLWIATVAVNAGTAAGVQQTKTIIQEINHDTNENHILICDIARRAGIDTDGLCTGGG